MKRKIIAANVLTLALLASGGAHAATECLFTSTGGVDLKYADTITLDLSNTKVPSSGYSSVSPEYPFTTSQKITSTCNNGKDGQILQSKNTAPTEDMKSYTTLNGQQALMYKTEITGLYYSIKMINGVCSDLYGYLPPDQSFTSEKDIGDGREKSCMKNDTAWKFTIQYFIGLNYKYSPGKAFHSAISGEHGEYRLSGSIGDVEPRTQAVRTVQFNGLIK
jgi:hypothetical protein